MANSREMEAAAGQTIAIPAPSPHPDLETQPLLPSNSKITTLRRLKTGAIHAAKWTGGLLSAAPPAVNSLVLLSGATADKIGKVWWRSLSLPVKAGSIILAGATELVNAEINAEFFTKAWDKLTHALKNCKNPLDFGNHIFSLILGIGGGVAAGAIAYEAFSSILLLGITFAIFNFLAFLTNRYLGVNKSIDQMIHHERLEIQNEVEDHLQHLKAEYLNELQNTLDQAVQHILAEHQPSKDGISDPKLNEKDFEKLFCVVATKLSEISQAHPTCFAGKSTKEYAMQYAGMAFDISFAALMSFFAFTTFTQKGKKGVDIFLRILCNVNLDHLNKPTWALIGSLGGLPSAITYGLSAAEFRGLFVDSAQYLYTHPQELPAFARHFFTHLLSSASMVNIGLSIPGPDNVFGIPANPYTLATFAVGDALAVFVNNLEPTLRKFTLHPDLEHPTIAEITSYFHNHSNHPISQDAALSLRNHSLFNKKKSLISRITTTESASNLTLTANFNSSF